MAEGVLCPSCGARNPEDQRFCGSCGTGLARPCPSCGTANPPGYAFCGTCGASLKPKAAEEARGADAPREERRLATVMFADMSGFTSLAEQMDPEDVKALAHELAQRMGEEVVRFGGTVMSVMGDAIMAVFGAPVTHEDDAERAVRSALAMRDSIQSETGSGLPLQLHIGVNTGEVMAGLVGSGDRREYAVMGDVTNTAARLQSAAPPGTILVGEATYLATTHCIDYEPVDAIEAKGKQDPVAAWRALAATAGPAERPTSTGPLVGREAQLEVMGRLWRQVVEEATPRLITIIGPPGIGKSRLIREFAPVVEQRGRLLRGRCLPYGETTGYDAFSQQVQQAAGALESEPVPVVRAKLRRLVREVVPDEDAPEVTAHLQVLLGLTSEGAPDKQVLFSSVRRFIEGLARKGPVALSFEDLHWAQPALLDLIESVADRVRDVPLLVIGATRQELFDARPTWGGGLARYTAIPLDPLSEKDSRKLALSLLETGEGRDALESLVHTGGGNPLFLEELAATLAEQAAGSASALPTTVQAIIAARLDALPADERRILQEASIIGRFFWRGALRAVSETPEGLDEIIDRLEARDLIRDQPQSRLAGDREFVIKHILTQEVAYQGLPKAARRRGHAAVAGYLERAMGERARDSASLLAHHWRAAGEPEKATEYLLTAAEIASRAWAKEQAVELYTEAVELLEDAGDREGAQKAKLARAVAKTGGGQFEAGAADLDELLEQTEGEIRVRTLLARTRAANWLVDAEGVHRFGGLAVAGAREIGAPELEARALGVLAEAAGMDGDPVRAVNVVEEARHMWPEDRRDGDYAYTAAQGGLAQYWRGNYEESIELAQEGYRLGMEIGSLMAAVNGAAHMGMALAGLSRHEEALEWFQRAVDLGKEWEQVPRFTARTQNMWAGSLREIGDFTRSRELSEEALEGSTRAAFPGAQVSARIDLAVLDIVEGEIGRAEAALPELFAAAERTKGWHQWLWMGRLAELKARAALLAGRADEAAAAADEAMKLALGPGRTKYACRSRTVLGRALLALGRSADADRSLAEAQKDAERLRHAPSIWQALAARAQALRGLGREQAADDALASARRTALDFAEKLSEERRERLLSMPEVASILGGS
jgi:class 3 adenylate cyclase/tetratricopeptide (TPR) repeat protein